MCTCGGVGEGGSTTVFHNECQNTPLVKDIFGRYTCSEKYVYSRVTPKTGTAVSFYHTQMHEATPVCSGSVKIIIRTDIMYQRKIPILTAPNDRIAYSIWLKAQEVAEKEGQPEKATQMFRQCFKMSHGLAQLLGM
eukprot:GHVR01096162.1.p1 GENE.GHVR01096162.1~~GHVR01096162.1.p1  ORF type:complete len:136 (-),score=27.36 GHVR01096162.1:149-556(-)